MAELLLKAKALDSQIQYLFDSTLSLPSFPLPTAALAPLYHHFHSFCLSSSLFLSFPAEFLQTLLEERQRMPLVEKGKGRSRTESWRVEVRQLAATPGGIICTMVYANGAPWSCAVHSLGSWMQRSWWR